MQPDRICFGHEVALRVIDTTAGFFASDGHADPSVASVHFLSLSAVTGFEKSVFAVVADMSDSESGAPVKYGGRLCLRHVDSGLYLSVITTQSSMSDDQCQHVTLVPKNQLGAGGFFKFCPRYRIHYEGDHVCFGDEIALQLFDRALSLHVSGSEVNASSEPTFCVPQLYCNARSVAAPQDEPSEDGPRRVSLNEPTQYAKLLCLFHRQKEGILYPSADAACVEVRRSPNCADEVAIASSTQVPINGLWMLESRNPLVGGDVKLQSNCRLRHFASGNYLQNRGTEFSLAAFDSSRGDDFVFQVHGQNSEKHRVSSRSMLRFFHKASSSWIGTAIVDTSDDGIDNFTLCSHRRPTSHDAFTAVTVCAPLERDAKIAVRLFDRIRAGNDRSVVAPLTTLIKFCSNSNEEDPLRREGPTILHRQAMLFDLDYHTALVERVTELLQGGDANRYCCRLMYRLLRQMLRNAPQFAPSVSPFIATMQQHVSDNVGVTAVLLVLFTNNRSMPADACSESAEHFSKLLAGGEASHEHFRLLSAMCTCHGEGLLHNQRVVVTALVKGDVFMSVRMDGDRVVFTIKQTGEQIDLDQLVEDGSASSAALLELIAAQVELLASCVLSKSSPDPLALAAVQRVFPADALAHCISMSGSKSAQNSGRDQLHTLMIELAMNSYLRSDFERHAAGVVASICKIPGSRMTSSGQVQGALARSVIAACSSTLKATTSLVVDQVQRNRMIGTTMRVFSELLRRGLVDAAGTKQLAVHAARLVSGKEDVFSLRKTRFDRQWDRCSSSSDANVGAMLVKQAACDVLLNLLKRAEVAATENMASSVDEAVAQCVAKGAVSAELQTKVVRRAQIEAQGQTQRLIDVPSVTEALMDALLYDSAPLREAAVDVLCAICEMPRRVADAANRSAFLRYGCAPDMDADEDDGIQERVPCAFFDGIFNLVCEARRLNDFLKTSGETQPELALESVLEASHCVLHAVACGSVVPSLDAASEGARPFAQIAELYLADGDTGDLASELPSDTVPRAAMLAHWGVMELVIPWLHFAAAHGRDQPAYDAVVEVLATLANVGPSTAVQLEAHILHFFETIRMFQSSIRPPRCRLRSIQVVMCVLNAVKRLRGAVDRDHLRLVFERVTYQAAQQHPDATFLRLFNDSLVGTHMAPTNQCFVLDTLQERGAFASVTTVNASSSPKQLDFNAALLQLIYACCIGNSITRHTAQRILPAQAIIDILASPHEFPISHRASYYQLLGTLFFSFDDETAHERKLQRSLWSTSASFWKLMSGRAGDRLSRTGAALKNGDLIDPAERTLVFTSIVPTMVCYFRTVFDPVLAAGDDDATRCVAAFAQTVLDCARGVLEATSTLTDSGIGSTELVPLSNLLPLLPPILEDLDYAGLATAIQGLASTISEESERVGCAVVCNDSLRVEEGDPPLVHLRRLQRLLTGIADGSRPVDEDDGDTPRAVVLERLASKDSDAVWHSLLRSIAAPEAPPGTVCAVLRLARAVMVPDGDDGDADEEQQRRMNAHGLISTCTSLAETTDPEVLRAALDTGIASVSGGNEEVQNLLFEFFEETDERFFVSMQRVLRSAITNVRRENQQCAQLQLLGSDGDPRGAATLKLSRDRRSTMYALRNVDALLHLLQQLCEGHHSEMQNYVRFQADNLHSVNTACEVAVLMREMTQLITVSNADVIDRALSLVTEMCQGPCAANQAEFMNAGVCTSISHILRANEESHPEVAIAGLHGTAAKALLALLEGNDDAAAFASMIGEVPVEVLKLAMDPLRALVPPTWVGSVDDDDDDRAAAVERLFNFMTLLNQLLPMTEGDANARTAIDELLESFAYLRPLLGCVQIERNRRIEKMFFPIPRLCLSLTEESRQGLIWSVDRATRHSKLSGFMSLADSLIVEMESAFGVRQRLQSSLLLRWVRPDPDTYAFMSLLLAAVINGLFVFSGVPPTVASPAEAMGTNASIELPSRDGWLFPSACDTLRIADPARSLIASSVEGLGFTFDSLIIVLALAQVVLCFLCLGVDSALFVPVHLHTRRLARGSDAAASSLGSMAQTGRDLIGRFPTVYRATLLLAALLGLFVSPLFLSVQLLDIINRSAILTNVIVAVTRNGESLLLTMGLGVVIVYIFTMIGRTHFPEDYSEENVGPSEDNCGSLHRCFAFILMNGLRQGGGIGDAMRSADWDSPVHGPRMIHDFVFFAVMNIVFMNILFGIIIDTFAELRDMKSSIEEDIATCCFICGLESQDFEQAGKSFEKHVAGEHEMWQYLYLLHHLRRKDPNEYNGQESFVMALVEQGDLSFFPNRRCLELVDSGDGEHDEPETNDGDVPRNDLLEEGGSTLKIEDDSEDKADLPSRVPTPRSVPVSTPRPASALEADTDAVKRIVANAVSDATAQIKKSHDESIQRLERALERALQRATPIAAPTEPRSSSSPPRGDEQLASPIRAASPSAARQRPSGNRYEDLVANLSQKYPDLMRSTSPGGPQQAQSPASRQLGRLR